MKKQKFKMDIVWQVRTNMFNKASWLKSKKKQKDFKCGNCGDQYENCDGDIGVMTFKGKPNIHLCDACGKGYIALGAIDIDANQKKSKETKEELISAIEGLGNYRKGYFDKKLSEMDIDALKETLEKCTKVKETTDRIAAITISDEDFVMEDYLKNDYGVIQDRNYLKCEEQIEPYFKDNYSDHFDCGQGYAQDEAIAIIKIAQKYYSVKTTAEIESAKQDRGDRLYWVEKIASITWEELPKPLPKETEQFTYTFTLNKDKRAHLEEFLKEHGYVGVVG